MPSWNAPRKDGFEGYWIKNLGNLHEQIAVQTNKILMGDDNLVALYSFRRIQEGNVIENYCPITCLPLMWKLLTGVIAEEMYDYLEVSC